MSVRVGVGVFIFKNDKVLVGKRKGSHGASEWAGPGGHLEYMETIEKCAQREVMEETGMTIKNIRILRIYELFEYAPKHYVDIGVIAEWESGEPQLLEPDRCEGWEWVQLTKVRDLQPLFATVPSMLDALGV